MPIRRLDNLSSVAAKLRDEGPDFSQRRRGMQRFSKHFLLVLVRTSGVSLYQRLQNG